MAYGNFEIFRPSESAYVNPGEYEATQRNIALEKATYLTTMDQFYADLEERGREFDLTLGLEGRKLDEGQREFDLSIGLEREKFDESTQQFYFSEDQDRALAQRSLALDERKETFFESSWLNEYKENQRQFNKQAELKQKEIDLGSRAAQSSERNDLAGNIFGSFGLADSLGLFDTIGSWF